MFYFCFSHSVNHLMCTSEKARRRDMEAVRSVPSDRLLAESDVHASIDVTLGTAGWGRGLRGPRQGREDRRRGQAVRR